MLAKTYSATVNGINADGTANTVHLLNPVPFIYITKNKAAKVEDGVLADVTLTPRLKAVNSLSEAN